MLPEDPLTASISFVSSLKQPALAQEWMVPVPAYNSQQQAISDLFHMSIARLKGCWPCVDRFTKDLGARRGEGSDPTSDIYPPCTPCPYAKFSKSNGPQSKRRPWGWLNRL